MIMHMGPHMHTYVRDPNTCGPGLSLGCSQETIAFLLERWWLFGTSFHQSGEGEELHMYLLGIPFSQISSSVSFPLNPNFPIGESLRPLSFPIGLLPCFTCLHSRYSTTLMHLLTFRDRGEQLNDFRLKQCPTIDDIFKAEIKPEMAREDWTRSGIPFTTAEVITLSQMSDVLIPKPCKRGFLIILLLLKIKLTFYIYIQYNIPFSNRWCIVWPFTIVGFISQDFHTFISSISSIQGTFPLSLFVYEYLGNLYIPFDFPEASWRQKSWVTMNIGELHNNVIQNPVRLHTYPFYRSLVGF